jgi:hypothetical protein
MGFLLEIPVRAVADEATTAGALEELARRPAFGGIGGVQRG